jgi:predicted secreted protein
MLSDKIILKGGIAILFLFFVSCSYHTIDKVAPAVNEVKKGEKFTIILPENHVENFYWKLKDEHDQTILDYMGSVWHGNEKGVYYNFSAKRSGIDTLKLTQYKMQDSVKSAIYIVRVSE